VENWTFDTQSALKLPVRSESGVFDFVSTEVKSPHI